MQTLASEIALTFIDDAATLLAGACRIVVRSLLAPVERLAMACDVAGVLARRHSSLGSSCRRMQAATRTRGPTLNRRPPRSYQRRWPWRHCNVSFRFLRDLT
jgi:hypothetical protein